MPKPKKRNNPETEAMKKCENIYCANRTSQNHGCRLNRPIEDCGYRSEFLSIFEFVRSIGLLKQKQERLCYVSGKITGLTWYDAEINFNNAVETVKAMGYTPINPLTLHHMPKKTWSACMRLDISALMGCGFIYMQRNWRDSRGCEIEHNLAQILGIEVIYEN